MAGWICITPLPRAGGAGGGGMGCQRKGSVRSHPSIPSRKREGRSLDRALHQKLLGLGDGLGRVEALGADVRAVHDRVAAIEPERILELVEAVASHFVAA